MINPFWLAFWATLLIAIQNMKFTVGEDVPNKGAVTGTFVMVKIVAIFLTAYQFFLNL